MNSRMNNSVDMEDDSLNQVQQIDEAKEEKPKVTYICGGKLSNDACN